MNDEKPAEIRLTGDDEPIHAQHALARDAYVYYVADDERGYVPWHMIERLIRTEG